jgi:hypothetical protein
MAASLNESPDRGELGVLSLVACRAADHAGAISVALS